MNDSVSVRKFKKVELRVEDMVVIQKPGIRNSGPLAHVGELSTLINLVFGVILL